MPTLGLVNIGVSATGILEQPRAEADAILIENGRIAAIGTASRIGAASADVVVDCLGTTVIPGLIDSHCHVVLGDYTPRQKTVDFLDSYVHALAGRTIRWPPRRWRSPPRSASRTSTRTG